MSADLPTSGASTGWTVSVAATPEPVLPELREGLDPDDVTPGLLGFLVIFAAVLACIPLFWSMTGKLRRVEHRARLEDAATSVAEPGAPVGPDPTAPPSRTD
ncbi:MAG TPA: hypothetical protein VN257_03370 [Actinotalea sp.]|nr:hypothetical protein [Actinotalea sp.]